MQKSKSFRKTSSPMSLLAVPIQQKAKKAAPQSGERSNAAPSEARGG